MLFNLYSELIMRHALEKWEDGIEIGGKLYNNLRYAYDVALLATTEGKLQELVNAVGKASEWFGLSLNAKKTQVMVIGRHTSTINILTTNLAECVCVCAKCDPFLPLRFHFFFKLPEFFFRIAKFPYAAFGPLFAFHCPIFFTKNNTLNGVCMLNVTAAH